MKVVTRVKGLLAAAVAAAGLVAFAEPVVEITKAWQANPGSGVVDFTYEVRGLEGFASYSLIYRVEAKGLLNSVVLTNENVKAGSATISVDYKTLLGSVSPNVSVYASLVAFSSELPADATGTPIGMLGTVMVVDVSGGPEATIYPVTYYRNVDVGAFNSNAYKQDKIALLEIPASDEGYYAVGDANDQIVYPITKKYPVGRTYYMALFETTQQQWCKVMGGTTSNPKMPVGSVTWNELRFGPGGSGRANSSVSGNGFFDKLCQKATDVVTSQLAGGFDLPTDIQWEIAARAGARNQYGQYVDADGNVQDLTDGTMSGTVKVQNALVEVGSMRPNPWGIHNMFGNLHELCRDESSSAASSNIVKAEDFYVGNASSVLRHGGGVHSNDRDSRPAYHYGEGMASVSAENGFRVCCTKPGM